MKRNRNLFLALLFSIVFCFSSSIIFASTKTYERTEENLGIHSSIKVSESVKKAALATPKVDASEKVYDFADLLTEQEEEKLYQGIMNFITEHEMDMVVVTIQQNPKYSSEEYADDFYDYNDFGIGDTFDGLLFLIDMDERMMWISTTGEAILVFDDNRIDRILDKTYEEIAVENYYACANAFITEANAYARRGIPESNKNYEINQNGNYVRKQGPFPIVWILIVAFVASGIFIWLAAAKHKLVKTAVQARAYLVKSSIRMTSSRDDFINSHTSKVYVPPASSSSGSSSGGSSSHSSSSGRSHGGGGRSF